MKKRCIETTVANKALEENQRPKIVNHIGCRFLKSSFTVNDYFSRDVVPNSATVGTTSAGAGIGGGSTGRTTAEPMLAPALEPLIRVYQKISRMRTDWRCKPEALDHSFLTPANAMSTLRSAPLQYRFAPDLQTSFSASAKVVEEEKEIEGGVAVGNKATDKKKKRVLVPVTGGLSSLACLWWAMQQDDVEICLCYVFGIEGTNIAGEMRSLMELLRYGRDQRGEPFIDNPANAAGEAIYNPHSRFKILPIPSQPYHFPASANFDALTPNFVGPIHENLYDQHQQQKQQERVWPDEASGIKYHPMTYLLLYRVLLDAAQAFECESIVFGVYGDARELIEGAQRTFTRLVAPHSVVFPFPHRTDALYALQEGALRSSQVWQSIRKQKAPTADEDEEEEGERGSSTNALKQASATSSTSGKGRRSSLAAASKAMLPNNTNKVVWTTPGPTLMADVAHYAWTCRSATLSDEATMREAVAIATRERLAQKEQKESSDTGRGDEGEEQKKKRKRAANATAPLTRRFLEVFYRRRKCHGLNLFNWCGNCIDCYMWRSVSWMWHRAASTASSGELMSVFGEYSALLTEGYWRYLSERRLLQRVGETDLTLLQHMFEPERVKTKQKKSKNKQTTTEEDETEYVVGGEDGEEVEDDEEKEDDEDEEEDGEEKNSDDEEEAVDGEDDEEKEEGAEEEEKEDGEDEVEEEDEDADANAGDDGEVEEDENDQDNEFYDDLDEDQFHDDEDGGAGGGGGGDDDGSGGDMDYD